jgi:hypothetical protein
MSIRFDSFIFDKQFKKEDSSVKVRGRETETGNRKV